MGIPNRWTKYWSELHSNRATGDPEVLVALSVTDNDSFPILREAEAAVTQLKLGQLRGVDNITAIIIKAEGDAMISNPTVICNRLWKIKIWPAPRTQSLIITLPRKGNVQLCRNDRTFSLIGHPCKAMLKIPRNRIMRQQAEEIVVEERA